MPILTTPHIVASIRFYTSSEGGRDSAMPPSQFNCLFELDGNYFDCRLVLDEIGPIQPGQQVEVPINFLSPHLLANLIQPGQVFRLCELRTIAEGRVERIMSLPTASVNPDRIKRRDLVFRVFVSSTFSDMQAERKVLDQRVFPKLQKYCQQRGATFQAIDLRWGISQEADLDQQTISICLQELERCQSISPRPNFIVLLGQRYGWRPLPPRIDATEFEMLIRLVKSEDDLRLLVYDEASASKNLATGWYRRDDNAVPAEYVLLPRQLHIPPDATPPEEKKLREQEFVDWVRCESRMRAALSHAMDQLGWSPKEPRRRKYEESATHQEIRCGILDAPDAVAHAFYYHRTIQDLPHDATAKDYLDFAGALVSDSDQWRLDEDAQHYLSELEHALSSRIPEPHIFHSQPAWINGEPVLELDQLCNRLETHFKKLIDEEIDEFIRDGTLKREVFAHQEFALTRAAHVNTRQDIYERLWDYIHSDSRQPLFVSGSPGSGKTAILARMLLELSEDKNHEDEPHPMVKRIVVARFIGATPSSTDIMTLLRSLIDDLSEWCGLTSPALVDLWSLMKRFNELLEIAASQAQVVLLLDALDKLDSETGKPSLSWLFTGELPIGVNVIASFADEDDNTEAVARVKRQYPGRILSLPPLSMEDRDRILDTWLQQAKRILSADQREAVLAKIESNTSPLSLRLQFEQAVTWPSWSLPQTQEPNTTTNQAASVFESTLNQLSSRDQHGAVLVERALGYLAAARHGLSEDELIELLSTDSDVVADFNHRRHPGSEEVAHLPIVSWVRLRSDLEPYLAELQADGAKLLSFYHQDLQAVAIERFLSRAQRTQRHRRLVQFFQSQPHVFTEESASRRSRRKVSELPYQMMAAEETMERMRDTLCDLTFVEAKCRTGLVFDLIHDCQQFLAHYSDDGVRTLVEAIRVNLTEIVERPDNTLQALTNLLGLRHGSQAGWESRLNRARSILDARGWLATETQLPWHLVETTVAFGQDAGLQALSLDGESLAVSMPDGRISLFDASTGELADLRVRPQQAARATAMAIENQMGRLAFISGNVVVCDSGQVGPPSRASERCMMWHPSGRLLYVCDDGVLILWEPNTGDIIELSLELPSHLSSLDMTSDGDAILFVAGDGLNSNVGLITGSLAAGFTAVPITVTDQVVAAKLSDNGRYVLLLCLDRCVRYVNAQTSHVVHEIYYERQNMLRGRPLNCAFGFGPADDHVVLATTDGQIGVLPLGGQEVMGLGNVSSRTDPVRLILCASRRSSGDVMLSTPRRAWRLTAGHARMSTVWHEAEVDSCCLTPDGALCSVSTQGRTIIWSEPEQHTHVRGRRTTYARSRPGIVVPGAAASEVIIGFTEGSILRTQAGVVDTNEDYLQLFREPVVDLLVKSSNEVIVASKSGGLSIWNWQTQEGGILEVSGGGRELLRAIKASPEAAVMTLRRDPMPGGTFSVLSVYRDGQGEQVLYQSSQVITEIAASASFKWFCLVGQDVQLARLQDDELNIEYRRESSVKFARFMGDWGLVVILEQAPWLEIWRITEGLPTLVSIYLDREVSSLALHEQNIVVGFKRGDLVSLQLRRKLQQDLHMTTPRRFFTHTSGDVDLVINRGKFRQTAVCLNLLWRVL